MNTNNTTTTHPTTGRPGFAFSAAQVQLATNWHDGQGSMLYAVASTGGVWIGDESNRYNRTDAEWLKVLIEDLDDELRMIDQDADAESDLYVEDPDRVDGFESDADVLVDWRADLDRVVGDLIQRIEDEDIALYELAVARAASSTNRGLGR